MRKLGVHDVAGVIRFVIRQGLYDPNGEGQGRACLGLVGGYAFTDAPLPCLHLVIGFSRIPTGSRNHRTDDARARAAL